MNYFDLTGGSQSPPLTHKSHKVLGKSYFSGCSGSNTKLILSPFPSFKRIPKSLFNKLALPAPINSE